MSKGKYTFDKSQRLNKKIIIRELFSKGSSFYLYPFKVLFLLQDQRDQAYNQVLISVPKRLFKKAVDRNKIKRQIKEAYRLNKNILDNSNKFFIVYIYTAKEPLKFQELETKLKTSLERLNNYIGN